MELDEANLQVIGIREVTFYPPAMQREKSSNLTTLFRTCLHDNLRMNNEQGVGIARRGTMRSTKPDLVRRDLGNSHSSRLRSGKVYTISASRQLTARSTDDYNTYGQHSTRSIIPRPVTSFKIRLTYSPMPHFLDTTFGRIERDSQNWTRRWSRSTHFLWIVGWLPPKVSSRGT